MLKIDRKPSAEVQRVIVCHIKQKDLEKQKFKRNKPCKQFRKQNSKDADDETKCAIFKYEYVPNKGPRRHPLDAAEPPVKRPKLSQDSFQDSEFLNDDQSHEDESMSEDEGVPRL